MISATQIRLSRWTNGSAIRMRADHSSAFTLIELLVVIAIIGLLAGLIVAGTRYAGTKMKENRIRVELNALVTAIEAYHAKFNQYPPDNVVTRSPFVIVNPVTNSLFYELTGVIVEEDPRKGAGTFHSPNRLQKFDAGLVQKYFGVDGILNAEADPRQPKAFLPNLRSEEHKVINPNSAPAAELEVLVVPVSWPLNGPGQPTSVQGLNPWRYVSTQPTNNPAAFDIWAEYVERGKIKIICNWSKDPLYR